MTFFLSQLFVSCLWLYHQVISPLFPQACRFYPSCSVYMSDAIRKHGVVNGAWMGLRRLARCRPAHRGGYDPVS